MIPLIQQATIDPSAGAALGFGMILAIFFIILFVVVLSILVFVFWLWMLIDCVKRHFKNQDEKNGITH